MERILARLPGAKLGDYLMTTPALAGLRAAHPAAKITLLLWAQTSGDWFADRSLFDDTLWDDARGKYTGLRGAHQLQKEIQSRRFDAFVSLHNDTRSAWACRLARIPIRLGSTSKLARVCYTQNSLQKRGASERHEVEYNYDSMRPLGVTGAAGRMQFRFTPEDENAARQILAARMGQQTHFMVLNPTCGGSSRSWTPEGFLAMARLLQDTGLPLVLIGAAQDRENNARLAEMSGGNMVDLTGQTSVGVLAALLSRAALHISVDTGTMHLAAAMQTPCVTIFPFMEHWEQRVRWRPWQTEYRLIGPRVRCSDCVAGKCARTQTACMDSIPPEEIAEAARELLAAAPGARPLSLRSAFETEAKNPA